MNNITVSVEEEIHLLGPLESPGAHMEMSDDDCLCIYSCLTNMVPIIKSDPDAQAVPVSTINQNTASMTSSSSRPPVTTSFLENGIVVMPLMTTMSNTNLQDVTNPLCTAMTTSANAQLIVQLHLS